MASIKGTAIAARIEYLRVCFGKSRLAAVIDALESKHQAMLRLPVIISDWYPFELSDDLLGCAERILGKGDGSLCSAIGVASCRWGIGSIYQAFGGSDLGDIARRMSEATSQLWATYYDQGKLSTRPTGTHSNETELSEIELQRPWTCHLLTGFIKTHIQMLGGKSVLSTHMQCRTRGDARCLWPALWK